MDTITITPDQAGCFLDNHRGHYIQRDAIELAVEYGYIIGQMEQWALRTYEKQSHEDSYPFEELTELCDEAVAWLNSGQSQCETCGGTGKAVNGWIDQDGISRCRMCNATGRGPRISGQNFPPKVPEGFAWAFEDGDFGLYLYDDEGNVLDHNEQE